MSTYYIGDVHGCFDELMLLLEKVNFNQHSDTLVFVGDLINRGPKSLEVLRFVKSLGNSAKMVLGNHDVSLLAYSAGFYHGRNTAFPELCKAPDSAEILEWLRFQPLLIHDKHCNVIVVHAGIPPLWSIPQAIKQARKAEKKLQSKNWKKYLEKSYKLKGTRWNVEASSTEKFCYRINAFTRMRYCDRKGVLNFKEKRAIDKQKRWLLPWFIARFQKHKDDKTIVFGHWAALGYRVEKNIICLDSGCAWGGQLTAISIENDVLTRIQVNRQSI